MSAPRQQEHYGSSFVKILRNESTETVQERNTQHPTHAAELTAD